MSWIQLGLSSFYPGSWSRAGFGITCEGNVKGTNVVVGAKLCSLQIQDSLGFLALPVRRDTKSNGKDWPEGIPKYSCHF